MDKAQVTNSLLHGITVLDLSNETAWFCSKLLADLGARVIHIEKPENDTEYSHVQSPHNADYCEKSVNYLYNNTNKFGITLDLDKAGGRKLFLKLGSIADIIVETFAPGYLESCGIDYHRLSERYPNIIMASITGFGQTGPLKSYRSCDIVASASGGQMYVCGSQETPPLAPFGQQPYYTASLSAAIGILIALHARHTIGRGQHLDISLQETTAATVEHVLLRYLQEGVISGRQGNLHWNNAACVFPCKDGHMLITFNREWETLIDMLHAEDMAADLTDERWKNEEYRRSNVNHIIEILTRWTQCHTTHELFEIGQLMRFTWAPVSKPQDVVANPQLGARNFFIPVAHPERASNLLYPGLPYKFSTMPEPSLQRAPLRGEHNELIFRGQLGLSATEFTVLQKEGVI